MVLTQGGHPPRATVPRNGGHQPKDWRAPTQGPRTGRRYLLTLSVTFVEVLRGLRRLRVRGRLWQWYSGWVYVVTGRRVPIVLSCLPSLLSSSIPGFQRCNFPLDGPAQGLEDMHSVRQERSRCTVLFLRISSLFWPSAVLVLSCTRYSFPSEVVFLHGTGAGAV